HSPEGIPYAQESLWLVYVYNIQESVYLSKKLITNNPDIISYDFYNPRNIFVLRKEGLPTADEVRDFLRLPFCPPSDHILDHYSFEHWAAQFTE
ncbi:MAG: hypothetical protein K2O97_08595, partial [Acetatifactor sp.]|nr:hypothetical protein [Acetatifactor sp.]